jgi:hypothetical protein
MERSVPIKDLVETIGEIPRPHGLRVPPLPIVFGIEAVPAAIVPQQVQKGEPLWFEGELCQLLIGEDLNDVYGRRLSLRAGMGIRIQ